MDNILMNVLCTEGQSIALIRDRRLPGTPKTGRRNAVPAGKRPYPNHAEPATKATSLCLISITNHDATPEPTPAAITRAPTRLSLKPAFYIMWIANT